MESDKQRGIESEKHRDRETWDIEAEKRDTERRDGETFSQINRET